MLDLPKTPAALLWWQLIECFRLILAQELLMIVFIVMRWILQMICMR